ncbi:ComF family protein [Vibrio sp. B1REV9]|uniref:ComF family protein n=1 Tax=Vibrio sp. B1REV9 TaxID=2751179 RepID=UPI001BAB7575|nr:phosphoribosyltransferase family protein [Vibrio sp. B1REV9]
MLSHQWQNIMHRVLGSQCGLCRFPINAYQATNPLRWCEHCFAQLNPIQRCARCGLSMTNEQAVTTVLASTKQANQINQTTQIDQAKIPCGACLRDPPPWQRLFTLGDYDFPLSAQVQRFKDDGEPWHVNALTQLLAQRIEHPAPVITCVPLHWQRYLKRGFNQSHTLARYLANHLEVRFEPNVFKRIKSAPSQRGHKKSNREQNLKGAFALKGKVRDSHVAIVDDVVTTGSTVRQLCDLLLEVGVESIDIYCICRTPAPGSL